MQFLSFPFLTTTTTTATKKTRKITNVNSTDGNLWIAMYDSNRVVVFSPEGQHLKEITFTARNPACTTWGGKNFDILFVATGKLRGQGEIPGDEGGHMFRFKPLDARGQAKHEFAG